MSDSWFISLYPSPSKDIIKSQVELEETGNYLNATYIILTKMFFVCVAWSKVFFNSFLKNIITLPLSKWRHLKKFHKSLNSRFLVCLITGHSGGKVNNLLKSFRNQLWAVFSCHVYFTLSLYHVRLFVSLGLYTKMTTLGCLTIIKNKKWAESFEFLSFILRKEKVFTSLQVLREEISRKG